jgi:hypothetical protein
MLTYLSFSLPFHYWLPSYTAATIYRLIWRSAWESFTGFRYLVNRGMRLILRRVR